MTGMIQHKPSHAVGWIHSVVVFCVVNIQAAAGSAFLSSAELHLHCEASDSQHCGFSLDALLKTARLKDQK